MSQIYSERELPPGFNATGDRPAATFAAWHGGESGGTWSAALELGPNIEAKVWTTREGIEAIRDACNAALVKHDLARDDRLAVEVVA